MKSIFKFLLKHYLGVFARLYLFIRRPVVVAVAGSINKPFAKEAIKQSLLAAGWRVRANAKNFNTEIGLPLAILGLKSGYNSYRGWLPAILDAPKRVFSREAVDVLVLGFGTSDPGDMKYLLRIARPDAAVVTDLTQRYLEGFSDMDQLMAEYERLAASLPAAGRLILNSDNRRVRELSKFTAAGVKTFSIDEASDCRAVAIAVSAAGTAFDAVQPGGRTRRFSIKEHGRHHIYAALISVLAKDYADATIKKPDQRP